MPMFVMGEALAVSFSQLRKTVQEGELRRNNLRDLTLQINNNNNFYINYLIENNFFKMKKIDFYGVNIEVFSLENFEVVDVENIIIEKRDIVLVSGYPLNCDVEVSLGFLDLNLTIKKNHKLKITFIKKLDDQTADYKLLPLFVENQTTLLKNSCFPYAYKNNDTSRSSSAHPEANETLKYITQKSKEISNSLKKIRNLKIRIPRIILISYLMVFGTFTLFGAQPWEFSTYGLFGLLIMSLPIMFFIMHYEYKNSMHETPFGKTTMHDFFHKYENEFYNALVNNGK